MFGYIRPKIPELKVREYDQYKGIYCSLCKRMGKEYGVASRFALSYDSTFLDWTRSAHRFKPENVYLTL